MKITIGQFDPETKTVEAAFEQGDISHKRSVNACLDDKGDYDAAATEQRVADVARGVAVKIACGAITNPPPPPAPSPESDAPAE